MALLGVGDTPLPFFYMDGGGGGDADPAARWLSSVDELNQEFETLVDLVAPPLNFLSGLGSTNASGDVQALYRIVLGRGLINTAFL